MKKSNGNASKVDMISNLPDPVLHLILSCLPTTEEAVRTSILSRRWRYMWTSVSSIDIDCSRGLKPLKEFQKNKFEAFVSQVLANSSLDLDSFRLFCGDHYDMSTVEQWIDAAVRRKVKLLDLMFCVDGETGHGDIKLPHCLLTCDSLEVLRLSWSACCLSLPEFAGFPALRVLELKNCYLFAEFLKVYLFEGFPLLEDLSLVGCETYDFDCYFCISCPKLKKLRIDNWKTRDLYWSSLRICCPNLVFMEFAGFMAFECIFESPNSLKKAVIHPQDTFEWSDINLCKLFAGVSHVESLSLCICLIDMFPYLQDFPKSLPNLKTLELITANDALYISLLIRILDCSPNLESLLFIIPKGPLYIPYPKEADNWGLWELRFEWSFERVKKVKLTGISAPYHMRFIELLLKSSPVLETMIISPSVNMTTDGKSSFFTDVFKFQRASKESEIIFVQDQV